MKAHNPILFVIIAALAVSCSNQRYVNSETDDLYFTPEERFEEENNQFTIVEETKGEDYVSESDYQESSDESGYFVKGRASSNADANQKSEQAYQESYVSQDQNNSGDAAEQSGTVNNFYGNTTYYEDDYYDDSYATRLRRFNTTNVVLGYNYYDPYFVSPYWNYGWSNWNPYPRYGWSVGWNSWYGWNAGFNYGWSPYWGNSWYGGSYWGRPYGYGYGNYWGYNNYWNGYNHGYNDGWNDGIWGGVNAPTSQRGIYNGRRNLATDQGFGNGTRANSSPNVAQSKNKLVDASGRQAVGKVEDARSSNATSKNVGASPNRRLKTESKLYQTRNEQIAQNNARPEVKTSTLEANPRAAEASKRYQAQTVNRPVESRNKYNAGELSRARSESNRYDAPKRVQSQPSSPNRVNTRSSSSVSRTNASRPSVNTRNTSAPRRSNNRSEYYQPNRSGSSVSPQNTRTRSNTYTPSRSNQNSRSINKSYSSPRSNAPSQSRTRSASPNRSYSPSPSRSSGRSYSSPSRSRSSSPSRSVSPSPSSRGSSSAPRSGGRSGGRR